MIIGFDGRSYRTLNQAVNAALDTPRRRWRDIGGPDSGTGIDIWLKSGKTELYVNVDQGHLMSCEVLTPTPAP